MTRINTNVSSLVAQNRLQSSNKDLQTALTRLSTGLRINSGSDDPAGLIASEALRSEITSLNKSISNTRRASQIISTADSALGQVSNLLNDIRGLVVEAANSGALSPDEIAANQLQVDSSLEAINRIAQTTTFQGRKLLDGSLDFITTPGTNSGNVQNLQINNAGLGRTGQVDITINVQSAATQARLEFDGFVAADVPTLEGTASAGSLTLTTTIPSTVETPAAQATSGEITLTGAGSFTLTAAADGDFAESALNGFAVVVETVAAGVGADEGTLSTIEVDEDAQTVTVTLEEGQTLSQIAALLADETDGNPNFTFASEATTAVAAGDADPAAGEMADGVDEVVTPESEMATTISITSNEIGAEFNGTISVVRSANEGETGAAFEDGNLTVTIGGSGEISVEDIVAAINDTGSFTATATGDLETLDGANALASTSVALTGGTDDRFDAIEATGSIDFEVETTPAAAAEGRLSFTADAGVLPAASGSISLEIETAAATQATDTITLANAGDFTLTTRASGAFGGAAGEGLNIVVNTVATGTASSIAVTDDTVTITLEEGKNLQDIAAELSGNVDFSFQSSATANVVDDTDVVLAAAGEELAGGADAVTETATIDISAVAGGADFNGQVVVQQTEGAATAASFEDGTLTVTMNTTGNINVADIVTEINNLADFDAEVAAGATLTTFAADDATLDIADTNLTGGSDTSAVAATGSVEIQVQVAGAEQATNTITLANAGEFTITARDSGAFAGAAGEGLSIVVNTLAPGAGTSSFMVAIENTLTINLERGQTLADISTLLAANADFEFTSVAAVAVDATDVVALGDGEELTGGADPTMGSATINLTAGSGGEAFNGQVVFTQAAATATPTAAFADGVLTITVDDTASVDLADIVTAIENDTDFTAAVATGAAFTSFDGNDATLDVTTTDLTGGTEAELGTSEIAITASETGEAFNGQVVFTQVEGAEVGAEFDAETNTLTVTTGTTGNVTLAEIAAAIDGLDEFDAEVEADGTLTSFAADAESLDVIATDLEGGAEAITQNGSIEIVSTEGGAEFNGEVVFSRVEGTATPTASFEDNTLTVTVGTTGEFSLEDIAAAISNLEEFTATVSADGDLESFTSEAPSLTATANALEGGLDDLVVGVQAAAVFELAGSQGSEVFNVSAGTTLNQLVSQVNLVADATGIRAEAVENELVLTSTDFGSSAVVEMRVLSQGEGGNFGTGGRSLGADVVATVNGRAASSNGNELAVNTATLNMTATMEDGFVGDASFTIVGGGANFQLGPDVVSNQQARVGIGSVNSARLGGVSGKLFELGSGESAALATDPTRAAQIVNEAIAQVTGLRGRLGAFQSTSLESNLVSLNDTVANLQEAESSIRDADFASESAALTRAQILVQSGTNVLSLANQNPQNVLSLLR
jgi:flagellin